MKKLGKFEILAKLGQGAMGVVYKARDPFIDRIVALKTLTTSLSSDPHHLKRFYSEARSAGRSVYQLDVQGASCQSRWGSPGQAPRRSAGFGSLWGSPFLKRSTAMAYQIASAAHLLEYTCHRGFVRDEYGCSCPKSE